MRKYATDGQRLPIAVMMKQQKILSRYDLGSQSCVTRRLQIDPAVDKLKMTRKWLRNGPDYHGHCTMNVS